MELQTVKIGDETLIPNDVNSEEISVRRSGIAKVLWRELDAEIPASEVITNGVNLYKG